MQVDYSVETTTTGQDEIHQIVRFRNPLLGGLMEKVSHEVFRLRDKQTRAALIKLGWTPPPEKQNAYLANGAVSEGGDHD